MTPMTNTVMIRMDVLCYLISLAKQAPDFHKGFAWTITAMVEAQRACASQESKSLDEIYGVLPKKEEEKK